MIRMINNWTTAVTDEMTSCAYCSYLVEDKMAINLPQALAILCFTITGWMYEIIPRFSITENSVT
jgi:hypothetical protein